MEKVETIFDPSVLRDLLPREQVESFFEAFYFGEEPAYDLNLGFSGQKGDHLVFELRLTPRPGQCLKCNLTWGLPKVFANHPGLNLAGVVERIQQRLPDGYRVESWQLGSTEERNSELHVIPLIVRLKRDKSPSS